MRRSVDLLRAGIKLLNDEQVEYTWHYWFILLLILCAFVGASIWPYNEQNEGNRGSFEGFLNLRVSQGTVIIKWQTDVKEFVNHRKPESVSEGNKPESVSEGNKPESVSHSKSESASHGKLESHLSGNQFIFAV